jgi:hypothetical protein
MPIKKRLVNKTKKKNEAIAPSVERKKKIEYIDGVTTLSDVVEQLNRAL